MERFHRFIDWVLTDDDVARTVYVVAIVCSVVLAVALVRALA